ncbi:CHAP domain-containing protein [Paenarthrobacter sp. DKR-5]|uniref:CHAP domain-containing protein n=1 Tax=Paenarthrobacter sp. DKR-5 TaxID=2835535 RepID=UPI0035B099D7
MAPGTVFALVILVLAPVSLVVIFLVAIAGGTPAAAACPVSVSVNASNIPGGRVAGYSGDQLRNAAAIINAGRQAGLSPRGQTIGLMVAMGESSLSVLDRGDAAGPDSRGLFQQRGNGAWGSLADRMNPNVSATNFFTALRKVQGWEQLEPTIAASQVQGNADPYHYQRYWGPATKIIQALSNTKFSLASAGCGLQPDTGAGDDLPWANAAVYQPSALGMFSRECVDFALWRVNQQLGSSSAPFKLTNSNFRPDGALLGSAVTWKTGWDAKGWPTGHAPRPGAVVWYAPGVGGADATYGHVAVVKSVNADGTYLEEGYNGNPAPEDHRYYTRTVKNDVPSAFLYVPGPEETK